LKNDTSKDAYGGRVEYQLFRQLELLTKLVKTSEQYFFRYFIEYFMG